MMVPLGVPLVPQFAFGTGNPTLAGSGAPANMAVYKIQGGGEAATPFEEG